jgi:hypothetical protein
MDGWVNDREGCCAMLNLDAMNRGSRVFAIKRGSVIWSGFLLEPTP